MAGATSTHAEEPLLAQVANAVIAAQPGAAEAFARSTGHTVLRVVRKVLGNHHPDVEDVAQEAMVAALGALPHFRWQCSVSHFVWRVAVLTALNARRKLQVQQRLVPTTDGVEECSSGELSPHQKSVLSRQRALCRQLLDELPAVQAEVLALHCVLGYTVAETAASMAVPINTVRGRLVTAKAALRQRLEQDQELRDLALGVS